MTSLYAYLTRAGMRHRIRHLKHQLAACEHDRARLAEELDQRDTMQALLGDLTDACQQLAGELAQLRTDLTAGPPLTVPAPVDMQDDGWDPEASVTTAFLRLRTATYGPDAVGPAVIPVLPQGGEQ